ncbi:MAG TPA: DUF3105 domain-containing protein [Methylomirabilota bacterium]|jgi:hypothetical protein|nr:DUF3105 domain-containing protein [Methylomirabilota bacterium]
MSKVQARGGGKAPGRAAKPGRPDKGLPGGLSRRQRRRLLWAAVALIGVVLAAGGGWLYARTLRSSPGDFVPSLGNAHIPTPETPHTPYNSDPPTSGPHLPYIAPWGVHARAIPKELQVHNLEDGGVVVNYRPECADTVLEPLKAIVARYPDHVVLAPYAGLDKCIAVTAWTRIDKLDGLDERRIVRFIDAYRGIDHHAR